MAVRALRSRFEKRARLAGISVDAELAERLLAYFDLLTRWNAKINLTSLTDQDEGIDRLLLEPLVAVRQIPAEAERLTDIGSGGGSPAIPMKLARPTLRLWMVESKTRKAAFLREAIRQLGLRDTVVEAVRYEMLLARPELHEAMDVVSVRALRLEVRLLLGIQAFLKPGGHLLLFRSSAGTELPILPPPLRWVGTYPLVDSLHSRLVVVQKAQVGTVASRPAAVAGSESGLRKGAG